MQLSPPRNCDVPISAFRLPVLLIVELSFLHIDQVTALECMNHDRGEEIVNLASSIASQLQAQVHPSLAVLDSSTITCGSMFINVAFQGTVSQAYLEAVLPLSLIHI